jgi:hypothetical protein
MRLPRTAEGKIDELQATPMLQYAVERGINYFDTAYGYHSGDSERLLGRILGGTAYRSRVKLATKMPLGEVQRAEDFDRLFDEQRQRLQTDHLDLYLLHGIRKERWEFVRNLGVVKWAEKQLAAGRIGGFGFSFHDSFEVFKGVIDSCDFWSMCQFQYNYMNEDVQAGTAGLRYAAAKGLAIVVMEPLLGGKLARPPEAVQRVFAEAGSKHPPADLALQWLWNKPEVTVALSGMSSMVQLQENLASVERSGVGSLSAADAALVERVRAAYEGLSAVPCTSCGYCLPCPQGVEIPRNLGLLNNGLTFDLGEARQRYLYVGPPGRQQPADPRILASSCIACRQCEDKCPQHILISEWMPIVHSVLAEGKAYDPKQAPRQE